MSDVRALTRPIALAVAAITAFSAAAPPVAAQSAERDAPDAARLEVRIDSLLRVYEQRNAELARFDSLRAEARRRIDIDTTLAGPFLIVEDAAIDVSRVAAALEAAWTGYEPLIGSEVSRIRGTVVTLRVPNWYFAGSGVEPLRFHPFATGHSDFATTADRIVRGTLTRALPADVLEWLAGETLRLEGGLDWAYRDLATSPSYAAHACFEGDAAACVTALGLVEPGPDWSRWYTTQQIRALLASDVRLADEALVESCVGGADAACMEAMRKRGGPRLPLSGTSRATLLQQALVRGGTGAWARLFDDAPDVGTRLANAGGMPLEQLLEGWRAEVQRAMPDARAGLAGTGLSTLVWVAALAFLAMRSTRWRLG